MMRLGRIADDRLGIPAEGVTADARHARDRCHPAHATKNTLPRGHGLVRMSLPRRAFPRGGGHHEQHRDPRAEAPGGTQGKCGGPMGAEASINRNEQVLVQGRDVRRGKATYRTTFGHLTH